jgi:hypothetical protein
MSEPSSGLSRYAPWLAAAGLALACLWLGQAVFTLRAGNAVLRDQRALADLELRSTRQQLEAERLLTRHQLAGAAKPLAQLQLATLAPTADFPPDAVAVVAWDPSAQEGVFHGRKMAPPAAGEAYVLWLIEPSQPHPVSAGPVAVGPETSAHIQFRPASPIGTAARFIVTREHNAGAATRPSPQGPIVLRSE